MLLLNRIARNFYIKRSASYLSNEFNNLINILPPNDIKSTASLNVDVFIDRENRHLDVLDQLVELRKQKESTAVPLFPSVIVKQLLAATKANDLIEVLRNRPAYGVFLDEYVACYLLNHFMHVENVREAALLVIEVDKQELCKNELVNTLSLQALFDYAKLIAKTPFEAQPAVTEKPKSSSDTTKIRVKFLRNYSYDQTKSEEQNIAQLIHKLCSNKEDHEVSQNFTLIAYLLDGKTDEARKLLQNTKNVQYDTLEICRLLLDRNGLIENSALNDDIDARLNSSKKNESVFAKLDELIKNAIVKEEPKIIEEHKQKFQLWQKNYEDAVQNQLAMKDLRVRVKNVETILEDLSVKRQNLWFFEERDNVDIAIFKKRVFYPKKWFGKKKKPRVIDNFYVPPEIRKHA